MCDPFTTTPVYGESVPTAKDVLGIPLGRRELTVDEAYRYLDAVDAASDRVTTGTFAVSWQGRPLRFAVVGTPANVGTAGLGAIAANIRQLRDPQLDPDTAAAIEASTPNVLYVGANVHGNEPSGTEATLRSLYELASRDDCAVQQVLSNSVVVLLPIMNPDGRAANTRRNAYWFDMNRDGWARTQPEIDGRIELERWLPPQLFADEHENSSSTYFFPPNNDPVYAEVPDTALNWIDHLYGDALAAEFTRQGLAYYTGVQSGYDFFAPEYGDTVPADGFLAAGMTFEKGSVDSYRNRVGQQWITQWTAIAQGATHRSEILTGWHDEYVQAYQEGVAGQLEPNVLEDPGTHTLLQQVPTAPLRNYFFPPNAAKQREIDVLVRRLQRMDVNVYRLTAPLQVSDYTPYGRPTGPTTLPVGTLWVPMAQGQKHWIQTILNEDTYVATPYFYDSTAWSSPLLLNVDGGHSGAPVTPASELVAPVDMPGAPGPVDHGPNVAVFRMSDDTTGTIDDGWLRYLLDQTWHLPYHEITGAQIAAGGLDGVDVLIVPDGNPHIAMHSLGSAGRQAMRAWVDNGGRYVAWWNGVRLGIALNLATVSMRDSPANVPGTIYRVDVDQSSPIAAGVGPTDYVFNDQDMLMTKPHGVAAMVSYPGYFQPDWFRSGYAAGDRRYAQTAVVVDEGVGHGHVISFANEPDFRGYTDGTERLLWNAIEQPLAPVPGARSAESRTHHGAIAAASAAVDRAVVRITVPTLSEPAVRAFLVAHGRSASVLRGAGESTFLVAEGSGGQPAWLLPLAAALRQTGVRVLAFSAGGR